MGTWGQRWRARRFGGGVALLVALAVAALAAGGPGTGPASAGPAAGDPPYSVPTADLAAALDCPATFAHPEHEPVLLVHGTFTAGHEQFAWNYELLLADRGIDACVVTYPDRGLGDMQVSAEYVAYALQEIHRRTGQQVDMVGHSQGATMPRWALKFWPSARAAVDDFVMLAGPNHGTTLADGADTSPTPLYPALYQFDPGSQFVTTLNAGDETPGEIDYSSIYSRLYDELVQPDGPVPTAGLDWGHEDARTKNLAVQDVCPGRLVDHITIGTVDRLTQELVLDALLHDGPVEPARTTLSALCAVPDLYVVPASFTALIGEFQRSFAGGLPAVGTVDAEPPLAPYARPAPVATTTTTLGTTTTPTTGTPASTAPTPTTGTPASTAPTPTTGTPASTTPTSTAPASTAPATAPATPPATPSASASVPASATGTPEAGGSGGGGLARTGPPFDRRWGLAPLALALTLYALRRTAIRAPRS